MPDRMSRAIEEALLRVNRPIYVLSADGESVVSDDRNLQYLDGYTLKAFVPALPLADLGDAAFKQAYHLRYAYVAGAMAKGIASVELVKQLSHAGMLGFFGAAGLPLDKIARAISELQASLGTRTFGLSLTHNPNEPEWEAAVVDLYLEAGVRVVEASAFVDLTLPVVLYRIKGIHRDSDGRIVCPNQILAKVSRIEVARRFFSPPPEKMVQTLLAENRITREEAELAHFIPMAQDLLVEADSGGHTDNRPAIVLWPSVLALRDELDATYQYDQALRVGLGGGIGTPLAVAAAFGMGAACVLTGSINQCCLEAGTSQVVREMLAAARPVDVAMSPSADLFERGGQVQVLKRGTAFAQRANKLYEIYSHNGSLESIPNSQKEILERDFFRRTCEEEWSRVKDYFSKRDPRQVQRAETDPKHKLALVLRSYVGQSSDWAISGDSARKTDYQIWCGPAMGSFNEWAKGSFLDQLEHRRAAIVALNLLLGGAVAIRAGWLRMQEIALPRGADCYRPLEPALLYELCDSSRVPSATAG